MTPHRRAAVQAGGVTLQEALLPLPSGGQDERCGFWSGGALRGSLGARSLGLPALPAGQTLACAFRQGGQYALVAGSGGLYLYAGGSIVQTAYTFARIPASVAAHDGAGPVLFLSDGQQVVSLSQAGIAAEPAVPPFVAAAFYGERLWVAGPQNGGKVQYSAPVGLRDFAGERGRGGEIEFADGAGNIAALCAWEDALYLFRCSGAKKLTALGDERDFRLREAFECAPVYGGTVAAGDRIYWLGEDGLHAYDGAVHDLGKGELYAGTAQADARGAYAGGAYYLQARARLAAGEENTFAALAGESFCIVRRPVRGLASCEGQALFVCAGEVCAPQEGAFPGGYGRRSYRSAPFSFGGRANLFSVCIQARGHFTLTAESERGRRTLLVRGGRMRYPVGIAGETFRLLLETDGAGEVQSLTAFAQKIG